MPMAPWAKAAWILASQAAVFLIGFYLGNVGEPQSTFEIMPSALAGLTAATRRTPGSFLRPPPR